MKKMKWIVKMAALPVVGAGMMSCEKKEAAPPVATVEKSSSDDRLQKRIDQLERQLKESEDLVARQMQRIEELTADAKATRDREGEALQLAQQAVEHAKGITARVEAVVSTPAPRTTPTYTPTVPTIQPQQLPWWIPPSPNTAARDIKAAAIAEWKDNYSQVDYEIKRQTEALEKLKKLNMTYSKPTKDIIAKAISEWPGNYRQALYETERQMKALENLQNR